MIEEYFENKCLLLGVLWSMAFSIFFFEFMVKIMINLKL